MHILVVNDDGPPSSTASPYILTLVRTLQSAGHIVSVILPHIQRSWIGKAHFVGQLITPTYYQPPPPSADLNSGTTSEIPLPESAHAEEWILVDGTPATCTQLGLQHFFKDRPPIDLVLSGPNYGRNTTSLFALSSGTLGGALEAAAFKKHAIALSYAFFSRELDQTVLDAAAKLSVKIVEYLDKNWGSDVEVYSVNVPLVTGVDTSKIFFTEMLENYWTGGGAFDEVEVSGNGTKEDQQAEENEQKIREQSESGPAELKTEETTVKHARHNHRHFKWAPKFSDVHRSVEQSKPGNDGWAIRQGYTSITPLRASFTAAKSHRYGEVNLKEPLSSDFNASPVHDLTTLSFYAYVNYEDPYVQPMILKAFSNILRPNSYLLLDHSPGTDYLSNATKYLQISQYESLPHEELVKNPETYFGNSYTIRKALIRKHYLSHTVASWTAKNPKSSLKDHVPLTIDFELDYAEFLDDALVEAWEIKQAWQKNKHLEPQDREWWILKPSMSDKGQGIRLFSSQEELQEIFDEWEDNDISEDDESSTTSSPQTTTTLSQGLITSHLRHFILQPYLPPLLLTSQHNRKFHIRTYVLAVGALKIYVYEEMLALFSSHPYTPPGQNGTDPNESLNIHLTNTALQSSTTITATSSSTSSHRPNHPLVTLLSTLPIYSKTLPQILSLTKELFLAATAQPTTFQPLPNCFELFGLDFLVDETEKVWVCEINAYPDFKQTGSDLGEKVIGGLWEGVMGIVGREWFDGCVAEDGEGEHAGDREDRKLIEGDGEYVGRGMWKVLDLDMGRRR